MRQAGEARFTGSVGDSAGHRYPLCSLKCNPRAKMHRTNHCQGTPLFREVVSGIVLRTIYLSYCPTNRMRQTSPAPSSGEPEDRVRTDPCLCRTGRTQQEKEVRATPACRDTETQRTIFDQTKKPPALKFLFNGTGRYAENMESGGCVTGAMGTRPAYNSGGTVRVLSCIYRLMDQRYR